ncbi:MAG: hypothetical protein J5588_02925 [Bacteroidales bacterium]|nr:hypothetical protein [Bacteroidales bacterium]
MEYYNNILAVDVMNDLVDNGVMSYCNYKKLSSRNLIHVIRHGCPGTPALVEYESLPTRFKAKVDENCGGNPYNVVKQNIIADLIEHSPEASRFFDSFTTADGKHLPADKRREYYANAIILNAVRAFELQHKAQRASIGGRKARVIDFAIEAIAELDHSRYPFNLPDNARAFERKYKEYLRSGYDSLIHNAYKNGKKNAAVVTKEGEAFLTMLLAHPNNLDNCQIARIYGDVAKIQGWKPISDRTVAVWRDKLEAVTFARRRGSKVFNNEKTMQVKRSLPSYPLAMWTLDGWDAELFYRDENGSITNRVTLEVVLDPYFLYPVGYAISRPHKAESVNLITRAVRNALLHTKELFGNMYRANQIQSDNYAKSSMRPFYGVAGDKFTPAAVGNPKSKIVERYFKSLNKRYCQFQSNWSGQNITSKTPQPNYDKEIMSLRYIPTYDEVCKQVEAIIERERADKHDLYVKGFALIPEERRLLLNEHQYLMQFGVQTERTIMMRGEGIRLQLNGERHIYDCFDLNFRQYASTRWHIRYDDSDMSHVVAVNEDESLQFLLEEKYVQPMALCERTDEDTLQLERVRDFNRQFIAKNTQAICDAQEKTERMIESRKELEPLQKMLLTDKKGQHKNNRNRLRLQEAASDKEFVVEDLY